MDQSRRRTLLSLTGLLGSFTVAGCADRATQQTDTPRASTTATTGTDAVREASGLFADHLGEVPNYDGTLRDWRGRSTVQVRVGVELGYGPFGFGPPAIQVDSGTTVEWVWTGEGGDHNVVEKMGAFDSGDLVSEPGVHYEHTLEQQGTYEYYCEPHRTSEMKGGILVGLLPEEPTETA